MSMQGYLDLLTLRPSGNLLEIQEEMFGDIFEPRTLNKFFLFVINRLHTMLSESWKNTFKMASEDTKKWC